MSNDEDLVTQFKVGDAATKVGGDYQLDGTIVAAFQKTSGEVRYVLEAHHPKGLLHIYSDKNLQLTSTLK